MILVQWKKTDRTAREKIPAVKSKLIPAGLGLDGDWDLSQLVRAVKGINSETQRCPSVTEEQGHAPCARASGQQPDTRVC